MMWMFLAILVTFLLTRTVTRRIRAGRTGRGIGNVSIAGNHIHHQVFGILIVIGTGIALVSTTPEGAALDGAAAVFGIGVGLTVDEFALWLHLKDVYWSEQGRQSVDAIFCVLVIVGVLVGGANFVTGGVGTAAWWSSMAGIVINLVLCVICLLKGKVVTGVIGIVIGFVAFIGAIRLAKPGSWWAVRRYPAHSKRAARAARRYDARRLERWNRLRDFVAGAPTMPAAAGTTTAPAVAGPRTEPDTGPPPAGSQAEDVTRPALAPSRCGRRQAGCHSSTRLPSGSVTQPNRPTPSISCGSSATSAPRSLSWASIASRSRTRKLSMVCWAPGPK